MTIRDNNKIKYFTLSQLTFIFEPKKVDCLKEYMKEPIPNKINTGVIIEAYVFRVSFEVRQKNIIKNMTYMMTYKRLEI